MIRFVHITLCVLIALSMQSVYAMDQETSPPCDIWSIAKNHPVVCITAVAATGLFFVGGAFWWNQKRNRKKSDDKPAQFKFLVKPTEAVTHGPSEIIKQSLETLPLEDIKPVVAPKQFINVYFDILNEKTCAPVHIAAAEGDCEILIQLLQMHVKNASLEGPARMIPIMFSAGNGHVLATQLLLEHGGLLHPNAVDKTHMTTLAHAASHGHIEITRMLVEYIKSKHAAKHICDQFFMRPTPLHCAINNQVYEVARYLLDQGAHLASRDLAGQPPVHLAVKQKYNESFMAYLLSMCDDINLLNRDELTPLDVALNFGCIKMVILLRGLGAKTAQELADKQKTTIELMARILSKCDNDINMVRYGRTPLDLAREYHYAEAEELLVQAGAKTAQELKEIKEHGKLE